MLVVGRWPEAKSRVGANNTFVIFPDRFVIRQGLEECEEHQGEESSKEGVVESVENYYFN